MRITTQRGDKMSEPFKRKNVMMPINVYEAVRRWFVRGHRNEEEAIADERLIQSWIEEKEEADYRRLEFAAEVIAKRTRKISP